MIVSKATAYPMYILKGLNRGPGASLVCFAMDSMYAASSVRKALIAGAPSVERVSWSGSGRSFTMWSVISDWARPVWADT